MARGSTLGCGDFEPRAGALEAEAVVAVSLTPLTDLDRVLDLQRVRVLGRLLGGPRDVVLGRAWAGALDRWNMMAFFGLIVGTNPDEDEYYTTSETMSALFGGSCVSWWEQLACHNGINMDGTMWSQPC